MGLRNPYPTSLAIAAISCHCSSVLNLRDVGPAPQPASRKFSYNSYVDSKDTGMVEWTGLEWNGTEVSVRPLTLNILVQCLVTLNTVFELIKTGF